jgi:hypothetical protein
MGQYTLISKVTKEQKLSWRLFLLFSVLVLSILPLYRYQNYGGWPIGELVYDHTRLGKAFFALEIPHTDPGVVASVSYLFDPFDLLIGAFGALFGLRFAALLLPSLLGIITLILLYKIVSQFLPSPQYHLLAGLFVLTNPVFLAVFSEATNLTVIATALTSGAYFFLRKDHLWKLSFLFFGLLFFYPLFHALLAIPLLLMLSTAREKKKHAFILSLFLIAGIIISLFMKNNFFYISTPSLLSFIQQLFSDLGGKFGFSVFGMFLSLLGVFYLIEQKKITYSVIFSIIITLFFVTFISPVYSIYFLPLMSIAATYGFFNLLNREWKLQPLQNMTLFLLILGVVFSGTSVISRNATASPSSEEISALLWLQDNSYENAIILTSEKYAALTATVTERRVLLDRRSSMDPRYSDLTTDVENLYRTRKIDVATALLEKYQIDYIIVFSEMKQGLTWNSENEGLLFVLENGENFKKVFENNKVIIWSVYY